jgi:hypothetical protein
MATAAEFASPDVGLACHEFAFAACAGANPGGEGCAVFVEDEEAEAALACGLSLPARLLGEFCRPR